MPIRSSVLGSTIGADRRPFLPSGLSAGSSRPPVDIRCWPTLPLPHLGESLTCDFSVDADHKVVRLTRTDQIVTGYNLVSTRPAPPAASTKEVACPRFVMTLRCAGRPRSRCVMVGPSWVGRISGD